MQIIMIAASLPPLPAGGAEWQALRLGEELGKRGVTATFLTPGKGAVKGRTTINGMTAYRLTSPFSRLFERLSARKKAVKNDVVSVTRIEYDDDKETTNE